ncbi:hypothetical protein GGR56DRAFT_628146 [Xylariaceae sp. FL0804]|nr:hypothetical protein GGR56DRAFT_628146 [Xylariaceae sp. FL0804]
MDGVGASIDASTTKIHPFFCATKAIGSNSDTSNALAPVTPEPSCSPSETSDNDEPGVGDGKPGWPGRKRRKTDTSAAHPRQATRRGPKAKRQARTSANIANPHPLAQNAGDSSSQASATLDVHKNNESTPACSSPGEILSTANRPPNPSVESLDLAKNANLHGTVSCAQKPRKILKFNPKTGTIGSPPRSKPAPAATDPSTSAISSKRGRKPRSLLVSNKYGSDEASRERIGRNIDKILLGRSRRPSNDSSKVSLNKLPPNQVRSDTMAKTSTPEKSIPTKAITKKSSPKKPLHPLFQGKSKASAAPAPENGNDTKKSPPRRQTIFTSTPCSPRHARAAPPKFNVPTIGSGPGGLKVPGAKHPAWPWAGMVHVRGDPPSLPACSHDMPLPAIVHERKAKGHEVQLSREDSIVHRLTSDLKISQLANELRSANPEGFQPISPMVRIPERHFETGPMLQRRIRGELRTWTPGRTTAAHPAISHAYASIATSLSAFDRSTCETTAWTQKYAPPSADRVLYHDRETKILRDWLQTLKVQAVSTGLADAPTAKAGPPPKKKRRRNKLEGFVVSSDEEADPLEEVSGSENDWLPNGTPGKPKKTVVRSRAAGRESREFGRMANGALLCGPHGCGKTATIYAIAKELDYEVFEINPGSRRSGKDILEKVGDMTRNHLVQHQQRQGPSQDAAEEDEVARDLQSGKQGMMTSFFKPKAAKKANTTKQQAKPSTVELGNSKEGKQRNRNQKQSLILLEEIDILYEEDKQFWATVISMMSQSRRPFIMTCNDEALVPIQNLDLHAILRFKTPPRDLAVDLLLLIAANEGHALRRHPLETLYDSRGHDLRASISELNYWCQIGVGDLRAGFDWFYPRWPKGHDVDEKGDTIRVVSQDTYHTGMGWLTRDSIDTTLSSSQSVAGELQRQTWDFWGLDMLDASKSSELTFWATRASEDVHSAEDRLALLDAADAFFSSHSDADVCGPHVPYLSNKTPLDATVPVINPKSLEDFTVGQQLIEASHLCSYSTISSDVSDALRSLAQQQLPQTDDSRPYPTAQLGEHQAIARIEGHTNTSLDAKSAVKRADYSAAFDSIAASEKTMAGGYLDPSVFDGTMSSICLDVAPYVRSIVAYDQRLQEERRARSNLLSQGGKPGKKRMRTTRSAFSALEGGARARTRRENYFPADTNTYLVLKTGGEGWDALTHPPTLLSAVPDNGDQSLSGDTADSSE